MKKLLTALALMLFITPAVFAQELDQATVTSIWPYPEKVKKVVAARGNITKEGKSLRMADVITSSSATGRCQTYRAYFQETGNGWAYASDEGSYNVSCKTLKPGKNQPTNSGGAYGKKSGDPRDNVEGGLDETDRTLDDTERAATTHKRIKRVKSLF